MPRGSDAKHVWVVGASGTAMYYNGVTWKSVDSGIAKRLECVDGSAADDVYATALDGEIIRRDGVEWLPLVDLKPMWESSACVSVLGPATCSRSSARLRSLFETAPRGFQGGSSGEDTPSRPAGWAGERRVRRAPGLRGPPEALHQRRRPRGGPGVGYAAVVSGQSEDRHAGREEVETRVSSASPWRVPDSDLVTAVERRLDRYELLGLIGAGGMGVVYRVRDTELDEVIALKLLRADLTRDLSALDRFRDEVRLARRVTHHNVARTYDIGEHAGQKFLTMEFVDGSSLSRLIAERGSLPPAEVVEIASAIGAGLSAAHAAGIMHRDLKPENVMIACDGRVVITDFGIACARLAGSEGSAAGAIAGTPAYMAPEQAIADGQVDHRADIYALGAVLFEMLTGDRAWPGEHGLTEIAARQAAPPPDPRIVRPSLGEGFARVVKRCLAPDPKDRFTAASEVVAALRSALDRPSTLLSPPAAPTPVPALQPAPGGISVAVLPLHNAGSPDDAYIADGLTEDLIDSLSMARGLRVRPRGVVARLKGREDDAQAIGHELGVQVVIAGSVRRAGDAVRFGVRLIGVADGYQLWARKFDAPVNDLLVANAEAAAAIARALTAESLDLRRTTPDDPAVVELYLRAKSEYLRSWHSSAASAVELFERALALAPEEPQIIVGCAIALVRKAMFGEGNRAVTIARARALTERAVVVAPGLGDAWAALASCRLIDGDVVGCARAVRSGLGHAPHSALLQDLFGRLLSESGVIDAALSHLRVALDLDPSLAIARMEIVRLLAMLGDWARCDAELAAIAPGEPSTLRDGTRARIALWRRRAVTLDPPLSPPTELYCTVLATGRLTDEQRAAMRARADGSVSRLRPLFFQRNAELLAFVGDVDGAIEETALAVDGGLIDLLWIDRCPALELLRGDPRWAPMRATVAERTAQILAALGHAPG